MDKNEHFDWESFVDIFDNSKIGLWSMEIDNVTGINKFYCDKTMKDLLGMKEEFTPEKAYEHWYSRIHKGYYLYIKKAINKVCTTNKVVEVQYPWVHPEFGDVIVRCSAKFVGINNGVIKLNGYHQHVSDLQQMKIIISKIEKEIFEWYQDSKTAYVHTQYALLSGKDTSIENFPYAWVENETVKPFFAKSYLDAFERINKGAKKSICELKMKDKNGEYVWFRMTLSKDELSADMINVVVGSLENINVLKEMEIAYIVESRFYRAILMQTLAYSEINLSKNIILSVGGEWSKYKDLIEMKTLDKLIQDYFFKNIHIEDKEFFLETFSTESLIKKYEEGKYVHKFEIIKIIDKNNIKWLELTLNMFEEPYKKNILALVYLEDIDSKKRKELILKHEIKLDNLTDILNKVSFKEKVESILKDDDKDKKWVLVINLDNFKNFNHKFGNLEGDKFLKYISSLLIDMFEDDIISRFDGDKFIILTKNKNREVLKGILYKFIENVKNYRKFEQTCTVICNLLCNNEIIQFLETFDSRLGYIKKQNKKDTILWMEGKFDSTLIEHLEDEEKDIYTIKNNKKNYNSLNEVVYYEGNITYIIDAIDYKIIDANQAFYDLVGKREDEVLGLECYKILHNREKPCDLCKSIFWNYEEFFVWTQYNKVYEKEFLLKNKLVNLKNKKCMFTVANNISVSENKFKKELNDDINVITLSTISQFAKNNSYEENIQFILGIMCSFYKSEQGFIFEIKNNQKIDTYSLSDGYVEVKHFLETLIIEQFLASPITEVTYLTLDKDVMAINYNLHIFMSKYHILNMLILPIVQSETYLAYAIFINSMEIDSRKFSLKLQNYSSNLAYFISEEIVKKNLRNNIIIEQNFDSLTGILNRNAYRKYEITYDPDTVTSIGAICLALNELNNINHSAGVNAGDQILVQLSDILKGQFYFNDIFRLNGNEFLVLFKNTNYETFLHEIEELKKSLEKVGLSITYGKVWSKEEKELSHIVNSAIYLRKLESKKTKEIINSKSIAKRNILLSELMVSIQAIEFEVFLQPKFNSDDTLLGGAEALIRKKNVEGGYISPDKFIPVLEHHYLIHYIDLFVFEEVLKLLVKWKKEGKRLISISLNFSRRTLLEDDIIKKVLYIKNKYDIDPKYIEIEVTESIGDLEKEVICHVLKEIESLGFSILLDDFGVKYSNLTILSSINFDGLKIDKSMVKNLGNNKTNEVIMKNIIHMCKDLNIKTVAEGVETLEQENLLKNMKCDMLQGYLYSKPISIQEFCEKFY